MFFPKSIHIEIGLVMRGVVGGGGGGGGEVCGEEGIISIRTRLCAH